MLCSDESASREAGDFMTRRMQAEQFQALLRDGQAMMPITPALLESVDWYREADAAARQAMTAPREPEDALEELDRGPFGDGIAPASGSSGSSVESPRLASSPEARPSTSRLDRRAVIEMPPILKSAGHGRSHVSLIVIAIAGAIVGFSIFAVARLVLWM
jgi:hypothetical protein